MSDPGPRCFALPCQLALTRRTLRPSAAKIKQGIVNVLINKETGKLAELSTTKPFLEAFIEGTEPGAEEVEEDENGVLTESLPEKVDDEDYLNL